MSNVSDRDNTGTVMTGANTENEIPDIHAEQAAAEGVVRVPVRPRVNGQLYTIVIEPRMTLLDAWREELGLTGTKKACDRGECRACTVHVDGRRVLSCMTLAAMQESKSDIDFSAAAQRPDSSVFNEMNEHIIARYSHYKYHSVSLN